MFFLFFIYSQAIFSFLPFYLHFFQLLIFESRINNILSFFFLSCLNILSNFAFETPSISNVSKFS